MRGPTAWVAVVFGAACLSSVSQAGPAAPGQLRCEGLVNPLGIDRRSRDFPGRFRPACTVWHSRRASSLLPTRPTNWRRTKGPSGIPARSNRVVRSGFPTPAHRWRRVPAAGGKSACGIRPAWSRRGVRRRPSAWDRCPRRTGAGSGSGPTGCRITRDRSPGCARPSRWNRCRLSLPPTFRTGLLRTLCQRREGGR